jgi:hypothetical protein
LKTFKSFTCGKSFWDSARSEAFPFILCPCAKLALQTDRGFLEKRHEVRLTGSPYPDGSRANMALNTVCGFLAKHQELESPSLKWWRSSSFSQFLNQPGNKDSSLCPERITSQFLKQMIPDTGTV